MRTRVSALLIVAATLAGAGGCVSLKRTPEARFFVLRALAETPSDRDDLAQGGVVGVLPVRVPGHTDRPQMVEWTGENEIRVDEFARWAEPLQSSVTQVMTENLAVLMPHHRVLEYPWQGGREMSCRVLVEMRTFGPHADRTVHLTGRWALLPLSGDMALERAEFEYVSEPLPSPASPGAAVGVMSELLLDLSRDVGRAVQALPYTSRELSVSEAD